MSQEVKVKLKSMKERKWNWMIANYLPFDSRNNKAQQFLAFCLGHPGWSKLQKIAKKSQIQKYQNNCYFIQSNIKTNMAAVPWY